MKNSEKVNHLGQVPLFAELNKKELGALARHVDETTVRAGTKLSEEGHIGRQFGIIVSGGADVRRNSRKLASLGPGDFFGEMGLLLHRPASATVVCSEESGILVMHASDFHIVMDDIPSLWRKLATGLANRLLEADRKLAI